MLNITSIVTKDADYLKGFQSVKSLVGVVASSIALDDTADPYSFRPSFTKASMNNDVKELKLSKPISLISNSITTEDEFSFTDCTMVLSRDASQNRMLVSLVDEQGRIIGDDNRDGATFFLNEDDIFTACKIHQDLDRNETVAAGQRITGDNIPLIKLVEHVTESTIIANNGEDLRKVSDYIYHAALGEKLEAFIQRGLDIAEKPAVSYAPTAYFH